MKLQNSWQQVALGGAFAVGRKKSRLSILEVSRKGEWSKSKLVQLFVIYL